MATRHVWSRLSSYWADKNLSLAAKGLLTIVMHITDQESA
jgi:hypothetical protein